MKRARSYALVLFSVLGASPARATAADALFALPPPTGPHAVGRVTFHWTDSSRGDVLATVFPDGRAVPFATQPWKAGSATEEASIAYGRERLRWWADDIRFVLDELGRQDRRGARVAPFAGHLDLRKVGALGHSSGGRAAAAACRDDLRFRACLNQDGLVMMQPYDRAAGRGLARPFLLFVRPPPPWPPPEAELAKMGLILSAAEALVTKLRAEQDAAMQNTGRGSYRVTLATPGVSHMSFSDLAVLQAAGDAAETDRAVRNLDTIRAYTRAFFDKSLHGARNTVLDAAGADEGVKVERFPKP